MSPRAPSHWLYWLSVQERKRTQNGRDWEKKHTHTPKISQPQSDILIRNKLWSFLGSLVSDPDSRNFYSLIYRAAHLPQLCSL